MAVVERAVAEVDLSAVAANLAALRGFAPDARQLAVVKADAYGHGMLPVARTARAAGVDYLGVALPAEAVHLRRNGDTGPLFCWLYPPGQDLAPCIESEVELSASSPTMLDQITEAAARAGRRARVHLKVDTGLGRNGAQPHAWGELLSEAMRQQEAGRVELVGVWSHLASADDPGSGATEQQLAAFEHALAEAAAVGLQPELRHIAATGGAVGHPASHYDMVRYGIGIYGLTPGLPLGSSGELGLLPAMTVRARVALVKEVPADHGVSYGLRYRTAARTRLALVPVGYADGLPRAGSGRLPLQVAGERFTVAGTIAMDQVVVDVGNHPVGAGDEVLLFGPGRAGEPTADDWAAACDTINYEIVTRLGPRIPRRHIGGDQ